MLIDTHCHIHDDDYQIDADSAISKAHSHGVMRMICVGTSVANSKTALNFANDHEGLFASVGVHPHEADSGIDGLEKLIFDNKNSSKLVAVGEIGLDYHYNHSSHSKQIEVLKYQIELAIKYDMPIIFHVREAYEDFWPIFDEYIQTGHKIRGVIHSFTDNADNAYKAIDRGFFLGINGYSTFVKDEASKKMFSELPLDRILIETDAPYLTPEPFRGRVNEPAFVRVIAEFNGSIRHISVDEIEKSTTANANSLFNL